MGTVFYAAANETATITNTFTSSGAPADPTTVTLIVTDPLGGSNTYTYAGGQVTRSSLGVFYRDVSTPTAGTWSYQWIGTGAVPDVEHGTFDVQAIDLGHLYATPAQLKSRLTIPSTDTQSDLELQQACRAASRAIEQYCRRVFWRGPAEARVLTPTDGYLLDLGPFNDLVSLSGFASDADYDGTFETTWLLTDLELVTPPAGPEARPYEQIRPIGVALFPWLQRWPYRTGRVQITGVWGWPAVPAAISEATRQLAAAIFRAKDAPLGIASFGDAGVMRVQQNPQVQMLAAPYRHATALGAFA